jgi:hypothetical protein
VRATVEDGARTVTAQFRFVDLKPVGVKQTQGLYLKTPHRLYQATVTSEPGHPAGRAHLHRLTSWSGRTVRCPRLGHHIGYRADTVTIEVPRACLADPAWVRVELYNTTEWGVGPWTPVFVDNPQNRRSEPLLFTHRIWPPG